jgi:hypothetical protein
MEKNTTIASNLLKQIQSMNARDVKLGYGSFITLGFGPDIVEYEIIIRGKKERNVRPAWFLWVYMCYWQLEKNHRVIADSDDERDKIKNALKLLEGKKLIRADILSDVYDTVLEFEDEITLNLIANNSEDDNEQWKFFTPDQNVLVVGPFTQLIYVDVNAIKESG